ncbi:Long chain acyl-CoA synthetase 7 peroxisomal [Dinochytrium kinnereticum]|nr:Long chain acyl-CoA synthetase 7 peroxisomal [Dinochytrium kinnereticum]
MSPPKAAAPSSFTTEVVGAPSVPGEGKPRVNAFLTTPGKVVVFPDGITNLHENLLTGMKKSGNKPFLGTRPIVNGVAGPYIWQSYNEVYKRVKNLGAGLLKRGLKPNSNVGLFSINRAEWVIGEHACFMYSLVTVPLYDTLGAEAIEFISTQAELPVILATKDKAKVLLDLKDKLPLLKHIVVMDIPDDEIISLGKAAGIEVVSILDVEREGAEAPADPILPTADTIATICYTSGTTGLPKGVIISHKNLLAFLAAAQELTKAKRFIGITEEDSHISYLPLAHVFERVVQLILTNSGGRIGFYQGDTLKLLDDVAELKPTVFASVPRLFNRIYDKVMAGVKAKSAVAQFLFNTAFAAKKNGLANGTVNHWLWDKLVFGNIRSKLGGNVRLMFTGAAPISADVMDFLRICFSADVYEGYGQTETCAGLTVTDRFDLTSGHVGVPIPTCEVKLVDVEGMNYTSLDKPFPRGEIWVRGSGVFQGYYKSPDKTAEVLTADGWCKTGDVAMWDERGRLKIIDRVKNIFKLAQGEYIAPEKIEIVYQKHELVAQAFVYGDSLQATLVGVVVPDEETFVPWAKSKGVDKPFAELVKDATLTKTLLKLLEEHGKKDGLKGFENIKALHLDSTLFSVDNNLLTPTFKLKRFEAKKLYQAQITAMYAATAQ